MILPSDIVEKFDYRTYEKSAALFNMIQHILGENNFKAAIKEFVETL